jgi:hypothetical protein
LVVFSNDKSTFWLDIKQGSAMGKGQYRVWGRYKLGNPKLPRTLLVDHALDCSQGRIATFGIATDGYSTEGAHPLRVPAPDSPEGLFLNGACSFLSGGFRWKAGHADAMSEGAKVRSRALTDAQTAQGSSTMTRAPSKAAGELIEKRAEPRQHGARPDLGHA